MQVGPRLVSSAVRAGRGEECVFSGGGAMPVARLAEHNSLALLPRSPVADSTVLVLLVRTSSACEVGSGRGCSARCAQTRDETRAGRERELGKDVPWYGKRGGTVTLEQT